MRPRLLTPAAIVAATLAANAAFAPAFAPAFAAAPMDLFLSEYVEGSSNNKALELFNGTGAAVDLAAGGYVVQMFFNGAATAGLTVTLGGTVADGDVYVLAHSSADPAILAQADQTSGAGFFNGDDAIVLRRGGTAGAIVDSIGQIGSDPGTEWGSGLTSTADNTIRRLAAPDTDPTDAFDPVAHWSGFATDTFDGLGAHPGTITPPEPPLLTVGEVQGPTLDTEAGKADRSPLAPPTGNGSGATQHDVRGVITQRTLARTSAGANQYGFFLQSRLGATDGDPTTSDGIFVFMGSFPSLIGGYVPTVGDEVVLRARVAEFFNLTQLTSASLVRVLASGAGADVEVTDAVPPAVLPDADRFWERHEGTLLRVRAGSGVTSGRDVFPATADAEVWLVDVDDPLLDRTDPYARRVFRDAHPLDGVADGNGQRIMLGSLGLKWTAGDNTVLVPPARLFDTLAADAVGGLYFSFDKYGIQATSASFTAGADPSALHPPRAADRRSEVAVATYNVENLYDFRDDPFDGCDFAGNTGCPGVRPPFDYVPASEAAYRDHLETIARQIAIDLHAPDLLLVQEAEDQDLCVVAGGALGCGGTDDADGKPDTLQELALAIAAMGGPVYDAAYDRDGADDRGIVAAFLYRPDRLSLATPTSVLTATPGVAYRAPGLPYNADVQNPKALNADLPSDVDTSTGVDGSDVYTRAPQVARFLVAAAPGAVEGYPLWAVSNHFSSTPQARVGQRTEQAAYGAAIVAAIGPGERVVYGGDLNVFPRPDDPLVPASDQLRPLYDAGLRNLWEDLAAGAPAAAYSYVFQGQGQTLDHLWATGPLYGDLVEVRAAHVNAGWPAEHAGDGARGASDHDPQVALFGSRPRLSVADASVVEGAGPLTFPVTVSRPLSVDVTLCALVVDLTARFGQDHDGPVLSCATLAAGSVTVVFRVGVRDDRRREPDERVALVVFAPPLVRAADPVAIGTIVDND